MRFETIRYSGIIPARLVSRHILRGFGQADPLFYKLGLKGNLSFFEKQVLSLTFLFVCGWLYLLA